MVPGLFSATSCMLGLEAQSGPKGPFQPSFLWNPLGTGGSAPAPSPRPPRPKTPRTRIPHVPPSPNTHPVSWNPFTPSAGLCFSIATADAPTTASSPTWQVAWQHLKHRPCPLGGSPGAALPPLRLSSVAASSLLHMTVLLAVPWQASDPCDTQHEDGDALLVSLGRGTGAEGAAPGPAQASQWLPTPLLLQV